jgi:hypothetical protein
MPNIKIHRVKNDIFWIVSAYKTDHPGFRFLKTGNISQPDRLCDRTIVNIVIISETGYHEILG